MYSLPVRRFVEEDEEFSAGREPSLCDASRTLGLAVKETHADDEYLVEAAVFRVETFEVTGDELGLAGFDVRCVGSRGGLDHLRRAVYGGERASFSGLANRAGEGGGGEEGRSRWWPYH